jgi:hypothetical protein
MLFQNFAYRTGSTYTEATGYKLGDNLQDSISERIISLQMTNNVVTDDILYKYINFAGSE